MARLHELGVELLDQRPDHIHVLHSIVKSLESFVALDILVCGKVGSSLISFHVLEEQLKIICINVVPKRLLPCLELAIDDGNEIPHLLELSKLILAVVELLLLCSLKFEQLFKSLKFLGLLLHIASLVIVLSNLIISIADYLRVGLVLFERKVLAEFLSVIEDFDLELANSLLDVV